MQLFGVFPAFLCLCVMLGLLQLDEGLGCWMFGFLKFVLVFGLLGLVLVGALVLPGLLVFSLCL